LFRSVYRRFLNYTDKKESQENIGSTKVFKIIKILFITNLIYLIFIVPQNVNHNSTVMRSVSPVFEYQVLKYLIMMIVNMTCVSIYE